MNPLYLRDVLVYTLYPSIYSCPQRKCKAYKCYSIDEPNISEE